MRSARARAALLIALAAGALALVTIGLHPAAVAAQPAAAAAPTSHGKTVYDERCADCHGASGRGDGPAAAMLMPRPRDFTAGKFKIRTTATGTLPTDDDLARSVRDGLPGSAMPGWGPLLSEGDVQEVVAYTKAFSPRFRTERPEPVQAGDGIPTSGESIARGRGVYERLQCGKCHGTDGRGTDALATTFEDDWQQPIDAANLTEPWTFHGGPTSRDIYFRLRTGMSGTPMPSFADAASDPDLWDLANFVVSFARKPVWQMTADEVRAFYDQQDLDARRHPAARGKYLVDTLGCALCHSPTDEEKRVLPGLKFAGGLRIRVEPFGDYPTGNLTSDKETGLGGWTDDDIRNVLTKGTLPTGMRLLPFPMDWPSYSTLQPSDIDAIVAYLRTIPPVRNRVPRPSRTFLPLYLLGKFKMLVLAGDPPMTFFAGNAGSTAGRP